MKVTKVADTLKVAGTTRFASIKPPEAKPVVPVFLALFLAVALPGLAVFAALYLAFQALTESIAGLRWVLAAAVVVPVIFGSAIFGRTSWRRLGLPGRGPEEFLPVRWLMHRRATARVKRLVDELATGETRDPLFAISQLAVALERRDLYTRIHSGRVSRLAYQVAEHLERPTSEWEQFRMAGLLHDLGKLEIPDSILYKPEPLDHREERIMRTHPILGAELIGPFIDSVVVDAVLHHHERIDGGGYPSGVLLFDRDLLCRVIPVCDTYDTLISDRPYRAGRPKKQAWEELRSVAGTQLDADLVEALIDVEKEKTRIPAAAAAFLPIGSLWTRLSHLVHTSTAPTATAVASLVAAATFVVAPSPTAPPGQLEGFTPPEAAQSAAAAIEDEVPPPEAAAERATEADAAEVVGREPARPPASPDNGKGSDRSSPPPPQPPPPPPQCRLPVTGTELPTLPAVGCPFNSIPQP